MVNRSGNQWIFQLIRSQAREVFLVGDFNGWSCRATPMQRNATGLWECAMALSPGVYRFRNRADHQWLTDYAAYGVQRKPLGDFDSVLLVEATPVTARPRVETRIEPRVPPVRGRLRPYPQRFHRPIPTPPVPPPASRRHVALQAARQRRLASTSPVGVERLLPVALAPPKKYVEV